MTSRLVTVTAVLLGVLGSAAGWHGLLPGVGYWDDLLGALTASVRYTGPAVAGLAAWFAGARSGFSRMVAAGLAGYAVTSTVLLAGTGVPDAGVAAPQGAVAGAAALLCYAAAGRLCAPLVRRPTSAFAVAAAALAGTELVARSGSWARLLVPVADGPGLFERWAPGYWTAALTWYAGLAGALLAAAGWAAHRSATAPPPAPGAPRPAPTAAPPPDPGAPRPARTAARLPWRRLPAPLRFGLPLTAALALAGLGAARLEPLRGDPLAVAPAPRMACQRWPLTICVHPAARAALPRLQVALTPVAARLSHTPGAVVRVLHSRPRPAPGPGAGRAGPAQPARPGGVYAIAFTDLGAGFEHRVVAALVDELTGRTRCAADRPGAGYAEVVARWLRGEPIGAPASAPPDQRAAASWFAGLPEPRRREWLGRHFFACRACELTAAHFSATGPGPGS